MNRHAIFMLFVALACGFGPTAAAVIIDSGDGAGNITAPEDFRYWKHVGQRLGGTSVIYLGNGWILTARHVGAGSLLLDGVRYEPIRGSQQFFERDGGAADLMIFQIADAPAWPMVQIAPDSPQPGAEVRLIGHGRNRGERTQLKNQDGIELSGWTWGPGQIKRWGSNRVETSDHAIHHTETETVAIVTRFDELYSGDATEFESNAAVGDSGGGLFVRSAETGDWILAGVMFSVSHPQGGPEETALYGDYTFSVDLAHYRDEIIATVRPTCFDEVDNDGDGRIDYPADAGCRDAFGADEGGDEEAGVRRRRQTLGFTLAAATVLALFAAAVTLALRRQR